VSPLRHGLKVSVGFKALIKVKRWPCDEFLEAIDQSGFRQANRRALACQHKNEPEVRKVVFSMLSFNCNVL
jgi:hypothetical protein